MDENQNQNQLNIELTEEIADGIYSNLAENIQKYEAVHGAIKQTESMGLPMNFGGPTAQA